MKRAAWNVTWVMILMGVATWTVADDSPEQLAQQILSQTGVKGGLIAHVGCGDGRLTAALRANDRYLVHGLARDEAQVEAARHYLQSCGLHGPCVSVAQHTGNRLPYIDNSVNLLVSAELGEVSLDEVMRVLTPSGVACLWSDGEWTKTVKPRPSDIDQWTHYLYDPSNNAVAHDAVVAPPGRYQWLSGPRYSRHHDHMSSISAVVSSQGRVFYIMDEAPRASILLPPQWRLIARDAFNGTLLWKRELETWHPHLWRLKNGPQILARRLVAVDDRVYVTLGIDAPLSVLDAATGETLHTFGHTGAVEEILCCDRNHLVLASATEDQPLRSDPARRYATLAELNDDATNPLWTEAPRTVFSLDSDAGGVRWQRETPLVSMSLAADSQRVVFHDGQRIVCLDHQTGDTLWSSDPLPKKQRMRSSGGATLVLHSDVVLYSGQVAAAGAAPRETTMFAVSIQDGRTLWESPHHPCGHLGTPDDLLVIDNLVWNGAVAATTDSGVMTGRDIWTGAIKREFTPDVDTHWFHHRCYRAKATDKYLLFSRTGIEFIDHETEQWTCHHWVRGACHYGVMPCNGLLYTPQHPCACYIESKLFGFTALAPPLPSTSVRKVVDAAERLQHGPAYDESPVVDSASESETAWPTFRHDAARSGAVQTAISPSGIVARWRVDLGGELTAPVVANGLLFVASTASHTVHALRADTGESVWQFVAGGRIDSPPTIWRGRALFGSADGYVYCVRADNGRLMWKYLAAPCDQRMMAYEQLESVWPVSGSVLVQNETLYCVAGRSMFLDGGLRLCMLDPLTGRQLSVTTLDDTDPETGKNLQSHIEGLNMPVALPDILSSDGNYIYMRSLPLHLDGRRKYVKYVPVSDQQGDDLHLFCPTGFLDDSLWHRSYWSYGRAWASGANAYYLAGRSIPSGRPLVFDDQTVYGYGRLWKYYRWTTPMEFQLFAADKQPAVEVAETEQKAVKKQGKKVGTKAVPVTRFVSQWSQDIPVLVNSMVLTQHVLFTAGPPDLADEEQSVRSLRAPATQRALAEQSAAVEGKRGSVLLAVAREDGRVIARYPLDFVPRFDGLIAADERLYVATLDGAIVCLQGD